MLKVDLVRSVSQNLVWVPSSSIPWQRYCLLVFTAVQALVTSSMKLAPGIAGGLAQWVSISFHFEKRSGCFSYLMQWVMMQGGRSEF